MIHHAIKSVLIAPVFALAITVAASGQESENDSFSEKVQATLVNLQEFAINQKDQAYAQGKDVLGAVDEQLDYLESEAAKAGDAAQSRFAIEQARLEGLRAQADDQLQQLGASAEEEWRDAKESFGSVLTEIQTSISDARDDLQSE
ncbi:MAG: hypothetical protein AAFY56_12515 [Pseudomonadota bacterium]